MKKKQIKIVIILLAVILIAFIAGYFLIPVSVLPVKYSKAECVYITIDGKEYRPESGYPSQEQVSQIENTLKNYKMHHTTESFSAAGTISPQIYIVLKFKDNKNVITDTRGISVFSDNTVKTRVRPFLDYYCKIDNGETLIRELNEILGIIGNPALSYCD